MNREHPPDGPFCGAKVSDAVQNEGTSADECGAPGRKAGMGVEPR